MSAILASIVQRDFRTYILLPSNSFILWIIIGLIAGWIAGTVSRGRGFGCLADVVLGLVGAVIGRNPSGCGRATFRRQHR